MIGEYLFLSSLALILGFILDLLLGDPYWLPHPVRLIGSAIAYLETRLRRIFAEDEAGQRRAGVCLTVLVAGGSALGALTVDLLTWAAHPLVYLAVQTVMCYQLLAARCLAKESGKVYHSLRKGDLEEARKNVAMIVGRDTDGLDESGIIRAAVETVAENTSDGEIAPMLAMALSGAVGGFFYKAVNTMDSMVGYKNQTYLHFGRAAAKLDDVLNFLPSRLAAILMVAAAWILGMDAKGAWRVFRRDRMRHASPNSAQTESACAGALGVRLAGDAWYHGVLCKKEFIGDDIRPVQAQDIPRANRLMMTASVLALFALAGVKIVWGAMLC